MLTCIKGGKVTVVPTMVKGSGSQGQGLRDRIIQNLTDAIQKIIRDTEKEGFEAQIRAVREHLETDQLQISRTFIEKVEVTIAGTVDGKSLSLPAVFEPKGL